MELVAAEKHQQEAVKSALAHNKTLSILDEILEDVRKAADRLEEEIEEHAFDNNKQVSKKWCLNKITWRLNSQDTSTNTVQFLVVCICATRSIVSAYYFVDERSECRGSLESGGR